MKPLGQRNYGSIAHLPGSRMGPADHHIHEGQDIICTVKKRDKNDVIIVQEKLDGSNVGICKVNGEIIPLTRAGYVADTSPFKQHHLFHDWVVSNKLLFDKHLSEGERMVGEWLAQAHGTIYEFDREPFVAFDIMQKNIRATYAELKDRLSNDFVIPNTVHIGDAISIDDALALVGEFGCHGAKEQVEGVVYRVERFNAVDFLAKFVRHDKQDGKYLESVTGKDTVWNKYKINV